MLSRVREKAVVENVINWREPISQTGTQNQILKMSNTGMLSEFSLQKVIQATRLRLLTDGCPGWACSHTTKKWHNMMCLGLRPCHSALFQLSLHVTPFSVSCHELRMIGVGADREISIFYPRVYWNLDFQFLSIINSFQRNTNLYTGVDFKFSWNKWGHCIRIFLTF